MPENREVEVNLQYEDKDKIKEVLRKIGAEKKEEVVQEDVYFGEERKMGKKNDLLRIRDTGSETRLTLKTKDKEQGKVSDRLEISTEIKDKKSIERILQWAGLKTIDRKKSEREFWSYGSLEIVFIRFIEPKMLEFMEVEGNQRKEVEELKDKLPGTTEVGEEIFEKFD